MAIACCALSVCNLVLLNAPSGFFYFMLHLTGLYIRSHSLFNDLHPIVFFYVYSMLAVSGLSYFLYPSMAPTGMYN